MNVVRHGNILYSHYRACRCLEFEDLPFYSGKHLVFSKTRVDRSKAKRDDILGPESSVRQIRMI